MKQERVFIMGDLHGAFQPVRDFYQANKEELDKTDNILIILGDFGANFFFNERDEKFKKKLSNYPFTYFVIRGNHEQRPSICMEEHPYEWHCENAWNGTILVENEYPYINYALDKVCTYDIPVQMTNMDEKNIRTIAYCHTLIVPGAYSADKYYRLQRGWSWFPQEQLSKEEMEQGLKLIQRDPAFDLVLSHTCPLEFEPTDLFIPGVDQSMVDKTMERYLGQIEHQISYKAWCFAHYHKLRDYPRLNIWPSWTNPRRLMLYNDKAIDLKDILTYPLFIG